MDIDLLIVAIFLIITLIVGIYYGKNLKSLKDFAVANRDYSNAVMVATLFATVIGGGSTFGVATKVFSVGIVFIVAFYGAALNKIIVSLFIAPKIEKFQKHISIGDAMGSIYGQNGRLISGLSITLVSIGSVGSQVAAVGFVSEYLLHIPFIIGVICGFGVLVIYSSFGGIRSVIATDVFQFLLIFTFIPLIFLISLHKVGGLNNLLDQLPAAKLSFTDDIPSLKKAITMFVVMSFSALDPSFIQRLIISKNVKQAIQITKITGVLSVPLFTIMGFIGLIAYVLNPELQPNHALPYVIDTSLPFILRGLAICSVLAALMSTADSDLQVLGLSIVQDLILPFTKKNVTEKHKLLLVRMVTLAAGVFSIIVALYFKNIIDIMIFAFSFWGPTVLVPLVMALYGVVFTKKDFMVGVGLGISVVLFWEYFLQPITDLDGFIPGVCSNALYFYVAYLRTNKTINPSSR